MKSSSYHYKTYNKIFWPIFFIVLVAGWYFGGIWLALFLLISMVIIDIYKPLWQSELTWSNIDNALINIQKYGLNPCELCFKIEKRKVYVYRDERGSGKNPIRMAIRIPISNWDDIIEADGYQSMSEHIGGVMQQSENKVPSIMIYATIDNQIADCKDLLKLLFDKAAGGLRPNIFAKTKVAAKKNIWMYYDKKGNKTGYNRT